MPPPRQPPRNNGPKGKTPADRAKEAGDLQRRLKREAAVRRETAANRRPSGPVVPAD